jgi:hypothetical protein
MRRALAAVAVGLAVVSCRVAGAGPDAPAVSRSSAQAVPADREWRGQHGGPRTPTELVARSEAEWQRLAASFGLRPPLPPIDFSRHMVVAVGLGQRPTGGYAVTILGAAERAGVLHVRYQERRPGPGELVTQALTTPYHARVLPRSDAGPVVFEGVEASER